MGDAATTLCHGGFGVEDERGHLDAFGGGLGLAFGDGGAAVLVDGEQRGVHGRTLVGPSPQLAEAGRIRIFLEHLGRQRIAGEHPLRHVGAVGDSFGEGFDETACS